MGYISLFPKLPWVGGTLPMPERRGLEKEVTWGDIVPPSFIYWFLPQSIAELSVATCQAME